MFNCIITNFHITTRKKGYLLNFIPLRYKDLNGFQLKIEVETEREREFREYDKEKSVVQRYLALKSVAEHNSCSE